MKHASQSKSGYSSAVSLIELLCVMLIIAILASLLLPALNRAYDRVRGMAEESEAPVIARMLCHHARNYCNANAQYRFDNKSDLEEKCVLPPKCRDWINAGSTVFVPFTYQDPTNLIVLSVHLGPRRRTLYQFTKADLSIIPESR